MKKQRKLYLFCLLIWLLVFSAGVSAGLPEPTAAELEADRMLLRSRMTVAFSSRINPLGSCQKAEKEKFFNALQEGRVYNPVFSYKPIPDELEAFYNEKFDFPRKGFYARLLRQCLHDLKQAAAMILTDDPVNFTRLSCWLYPEPEPSLILEAHRIFRNVALKDDEKSLSAEDLKLALEKSLEEHDLKDWQVVLSDNMSARASVLPASMKVKVNANARFSQRDAQRLKLHEIGVHVVRAHNGRKQPLSIFATGLPGYLSTEEGLATYNEYRNGIEDGLPLFALRVLGVHWALRHSFHDTFQLLKNLCGDAEVAWRITVRCKRGLRNTADPGAYTKDVSYLRGFLRVKAVVESNPELFPVLLQAGKIGLEHLSLFTKLQ